VIPPPAFHRFVVSHVFVASFPQFERHPSVSKLVPGAFNSISSGFPWQTEQKRNELEPEWNEQHEKLVKFKQKNGHRAALKKKNKDD
jgi:hypothetical protein